jgi:hypothetical protein
MSILLQNIETKAEKVEIDATYVWRHGRWLWQNESHLVLRQVPKGVGTLLNRLRESGHLKEEAPGLYRFSGGVRKPVIDDAESPLFRLALTKNPDGTPVLDEEQFRAGERLRRDYEKAHIAAHVTMHYDEMAQAGRAARQVSDNHIAQLSDMALAARQSLHKALESVGPELSGILLHVCCLAGGLEQAEMRLNLPRRAGKAVLQIALTRLARHYGLKQRMHHAGPAKIGHWATSDFRPRIQPQASHQP